MAPWIRMEGERLGEAPYSRKTGREREGGSRKREKEGGERGDGPCCSLSPHILKKIPIPQVQILFLLASGGAMAIPGQDNPPPPPAAAAEYPCLRRLRHRRLLNFLRLEGLDAAFASYARGSPFSPSRCVRFRLTAIRLCRMAGETDACFSVSDLRRMVERGQWNDGVNYLCRFLPADLDRLGLEAQVLLRFLDTKSVLANILAGTEKGVQAAVRYSLYGNHGGPVDQGNLRLRNIMLTAFHVMKQQLRYLFV